MTSISFFSDMDSSPIGNLRTKSARSMVVVFFASTAFAMGLLGCKSRSPELQIGGSQPTLDAPLITFSQEITSNVKALKVKPGGPFEIPVTIKNPSNEIWSSSGKYPITVSYKWFNDGVMLPMDGQRTVMPVVVPPGGSIDLVVKGIAPQMGKKLLIKVTLVQEGVAWFMIKGAPSLNLPAQLE